MSRVTIRQGSLDVDADDAVISTKSFAIDTAIGALDRELILSTGQCCESCGVTCWTAA